MSIISAMEHYWKEFAISLSITIVLIVVTCPLAYEGDVYECQKCGHKFRVNPYIVYFTNGMLRIFDFDGEPMKYAKLKCPHCKYLRCKMLGNVILLKYKN